MAQTSGGEMVARALAAEGIQSLFGLPSPEADPLLAQLEPYGIRLVPVRHEAAGVHMAEGHYKTTGQVAAVLGNPGPGSANLLPGVITARHEGVPVVVLTSQHRLGIVYPTPPSTFQGQDQLDLFRPAVKWGGPILEWDRIGEVMRIAFREMWNGRPGPVHVELPAPVLCEEGDDDLAPILPPSAYCAPGPQASETQLVRAAELLAAARRPLVINHPSYVYGSGPAGDLARREADVILIAGSRVGNLDVPYDKYWGDRARQQLIQLDLDPRNIGVTRPLTLGIVADARDALSGIARLLRGGAPARRDRGDLERYRAADAAWRQAQFAAVAEWQGPGIHPAHAMAAVGDVFGPDAVYVADGGNTSLWAYSFLPPTRPRSYHSILELGMLGTGIPQAIGAKLGAPERDVVCVTGDGAAGFNAMEWQSAARERLDITTVVFAEGSWTMEEPNELMLYGRTFGTRHGEVRWDAVAAGLGCHGEYADRLEDLEPALRRAKDADPAVVCLRTDHDANLAIPADMLGRFMEVYAGPMPAAAGVEA